MDEGLIIPLAGIMLPLVLVPTIITMKQRHRKREWLHQERLRALELGLPAADLEPRLGAGTLTAIGAGVPIAAVLGAYLTTSGIPDSHPEYLPVLSVTWGTAFLISSGAFVTSLVLGVLATRARQSQASAGSPGALKPALDPDAYDVVSMRG